MREPAQKTTGQSKSRLLQQTRSQQKSTLNAQDILSAQRDPLVQRISRVGSPTSASAYAAMISHSPASRHGQFLLQLQRQYGNRYVQRVVDLARKADGEPEMSSGVEEVIQRNRGGGQALDAGVRVQMESAFGVDFSSVRVHTDPEADSLNYALKARAFTTGQDIFFRQGEYSPGSSRGRELLAHELTHVVQQTGDIQPKLTLGQPGDIYEQEADRVADAVTRRLEMGGSQGGADDSQPQVPRVQRLCSECGEELQRQPMEEEETLQAKQMTGYPSKVMPVLAPHTQCSKCQNKQLTLQRQATHGGKRLLAPDLTSLVDQGTGHATLPGKLDVNTAANPSETDKVARTITSDSLRLMADTIRLQPVLTSPPTPVPPLCPSIPTSTPATAVDRTKAYCDAASCLPANPWLKCACVAAADVSRAIDAFTFTGVEGNALRMCAMLPGSVLFPPAPLGPIRAKGSWLLSTNRCIWGHWRAALEAIHDPIRPVPSTLTPEWAAAVATCRRAGVGSADCCQAHVTAEQHAIDHCGAYDSARFGSLATDVPGAPFCGSIIRALAPGLPFTGDFGNVADRITYGFKRCCA